MHTIGKIAELLAMISILVFPFGFVWVIYYLLVGRPRKIKKSITRVSDNLVATGFNITHRMGSLPDVVFDHLNRKLAFIFRDGHRVFDYNDVRSWQYKWLDKEGSRLANTIMFNLNNIDTPVVTVGFTYKKAALAEQWNQRLDVMLNAQNV